MNIDSTLANSLPKYVKIGNVKLEVKPTKNPHLVPHGYVSDIENADSSVLSHIKWLLQKDLLKQDIFLIGVPGTIRSQIVLQYLELCNREYEYLSLTRDTTEADIKQRREIRNGTAYYTDLCAVRAALNGRVLILDGVEKAERNVLPILNSLLESREMQLDDGRFLMPAARYDKLIQELGADIIRKKKVERVSENFFVIALGLAVPPFKGHSLDPPLRSRFQCRHIASLPFDVLLKQCSRNAPNVSPNKLSNLLSCCTALHSEEARTLSLPRYPLDSLPKLATIWNFFPKLSAQSIFHMGYPSRTLLDRSQHITLQQFLTKFQLNNDIDNVTNEANVKIIDDKATITWNKKQIEIQVPKGTMQAKKPLVRPLKQYVNNNEHENLLAEMTLTHAVGDFCLLGPKGSGKTTVVEEFANRMGYAVSTLTLYQDMNSRELLQERRMLPNGDTIWEDSILIDCAKNGRICILDGIEKIHWSALEVLAPLIHHRQVDLYDGTRLISCMQFEEIMETNGLRKDDLEKKGIYQIHPSFRIIAIGDWNNDSKWLNEQILSLFIFHTLSPLSSAAQCKVIGKLVPGSDPLETEKLVAFVETLRNSPDIGLQNIAESLTLRRLLYIIQRSTVHRDENICSGIRRATLSKFLQPLTRKSFENALNNSQFTVNEKAATCSKEHHHKDKLFASQNKENTDRTMVPDVLFYDNEQHLSVMTDMLRDIKLGSHLLLIGNQGVGKNKVTDRFLQLLNRPRQYIQLHRDTTVQNLTVHSTVVDGRLILEDSALLKAARDGSVLVIDEADKAPLHVVAVLKSLLDTGVMRLADGRTIEPVASSARSVPLHPDFRIIMLANRPGFPFLGNDLFSVLGDLFSVHIVENPSRDSELAILRNYAPDVNIAVLQKLCAVFDDLQMMADNSELSYPYSIRELVSIAKHLQHYPEDGIFEAMSNVFDFDEYSTQTMKTVGEVLRKHGIPFGVDNAAKKIFLSEAHRLPQLKKIGMWNVINNPESDNVSVKKWPLKVQAYDTAILSTTSVSTEHLRTLHFSEQAILYQLPINEVNICSDMIRIGEKLIVATVNPCLLYVLNIDKPHDVTQVDITRFFPRIYANLYRRITLSSLSTNKLMIHEELSDIVLVVNLNDYTINKLLLQPNDFISSIVDKFRSENAVDGKRFWRLLSEANIFFEKNGNRLRLLDINSNSISELTINDNYTINNVLSINKTTFVIFTKEKILLVNFHENGKTTVYPVLLGESELCKGSVLSGKIVESDNKPLIMATDDYFVLKLNSFDGKEQQGSLYASFREHTWSVKNQSNEDMLNSNIDFSNPHKSTQIMDNGLIIRAVPLSKMPSKTLSKGAETVSSDNCGFLEVVDVTKQTVNYLPVPKSRYTSYQHEWSNILAPAGFILATDNCFTSFFTCDTSGGLRKWEIEKDQLYKSLISWQQMIGTQNDDSLRLEFSKDDFDLSRLGDPKIGRFDSENEPHVGGNTWAGGTGGYDTAGLGGVGGPFRLDAGHTVHQLPQRAKGAVPEHIRKRAREIAEKEYAKRLKEINMTEEDAQMYDKIHKKIEKSVQMLRNIVESLEAKEKERQWIRHQTAGDLDDAKLVECVTGEKTVYRRRAEKTPEMGSVLKKPKRVRFCFDISGSMYRFNGHDKRLQRSLECALLVMEALHEKGAKIRYEIFGHSGEGPDIPLVKVDRSPVNEKERFIVLKSMFLHSQFCWSGDSTLQAIDLAINSLANEDADERFVIVLSDANLDRYGIQAYDLVNCINSNAMVNTFLILIGSLGQQAASLQAALPSGRAFVCTDTMQLPQIMQNILFSTLLR